MIGKRLNIGDLELPCFSSFDRLSNLGDTLAMIQSRIEILDSEVVDQIAAGEVVERPAHLVKELIENSLDAGSTDISIEFSQGGREVIIIDNGHGMSSQDLPKALARHATSKIRQSEDLWKLNTFGFRGEALASIAAVSKLTLSSKPKSADSGTQLLSEFGKVSASEGIGHAQGTRIQISDLFGNVPARLKFLKSPAAEGTQIKAVIKAMALAQPQVSFKVTKERELVHLWPKVESRLARAKQIFEIEELFEGMAERDGVKAFSIFAGPADTVKSSRQIWLFAQNRWIQDRGLQAAVMEAYRNLLMHGEYPIAAAWVELDPAQIDVNIHPTKSQVKFADASLAFRAVQASLRDSLEKAPWLSSAARGAVQSQNQSSNTNSYSFRTTEVAQPLKFSERFSDHEISRVQFKQKSNNSPARTESSYLANPIMPTIQQLQSLTPMVAPNAESMAATRIMTEASATLTSTGGYWSSLQVLGQADLTYLICQTDKAVIFVDQHAAHERVMFEKLMTAWRGNQIEVQDYLFPLAIDLSLDKIESLLRFGEELKKMGIEIEALGPATIGVRASPVGIKESALVTALEKMAQEILDHGGSYQVEKAIGEICALMACHSAIRAGQSQSFEEMQALLRQMDEFPLSAFCPHGRPVSVEYPFAKLEKDFGRIL